MGELRPPASSGEARGGDRAQGGEGTNAGDADVSAESDDLTRASASTVCARACSTSARAEEREEGEVEDVVCRAGRAVAESPECGVRGRTEGSGVERE